MAESESSCVSSSTSSSAERNQHVPILSLPEEVLEFIFSYLGIVPLMRSVYPSCKKFNEIVSDGKAYWNSVELFPWNEGFVDDDNFKLYDFDDPKKKPRSISSKAWIMLFEMIVAKFGDKFRDVGLFFSTDGFPCTPEAFELVSKHCSNIRSLKVDAVTSARDAMTSTLVKVISNCSATLQELTIQGGFPKNDFVQISQIIAPTIKALYIEEKEETNSLSLSVNGQEEIMYKEIEHLYLGSIRCDKALFRRCFKESTKLKSIVFDQCYLNIEALTEFLASSEAASNIQHLEILYCTLDTNVIPSMNMWSRIFEKCTNLVNVMVYACTAGTEKGNNIDLCFRDEDITACIDKCKKLEVIDIRNCNNVDGKFFKELPKAKRLETLIVESKNWNLSNVLPEQNSPVYSRSLKNLCMYGEKCDSSLEKPIADMFPKLEFVHLDKFA
ncbi:hypothetical protein C9374_008502 [Naegleria lovaniensis]|uniref:F-box domain-containing protein n=1 Tax=Naegleria lovaniensis TaxID=51637 RepID=A0AA88KL05_NAELO|nr:uncharacterized protein C9374_008502 [Naegleria lovaniensis]KAG2378359.1 hypothetical protein C9374_008502 [Naegleria lovaniensis]